MGHDLGHGGGVRDYVFAYPGLKDLSRLDQSHFFLDELSSLEGEQHRDDQ